MYNFIFCCCDWKKERKKKVHLNNVSHAIVRNCFVAMQESSCITGHLAVSTILPCSSTTLMFVCVCVCVCTISPPTHPPPPPSPLPPSPAPLTRLCVMTTVVPKVTSDLMRSVQSGFVLRVHFLAVISILGTKWLALTYCTCFLPCLATQEEINLAARRVSLAPVSRANIQSRSMSWRNGSLHWGRLGNEGTLWLINQRFSSALWFAALVHSLIRCPCSPFWLTVYQRFSLALLNSFVLAVWVFFLHFWLLFNKLLDVSPVRVNACVGLTCHHVSFMANAVVVFICRWVVKLCYICLSSFLFLLLTITLGLLSLFPFLSLLLSLSLSLHPHPPFPLSLMSL